MLSGSGLGAAFVGFIVQSCCRLLEGFEGAYSFRFVGTLFE